MNLVDAPFRTFLISLFIFLSSFDELASKVRKLGVRFKQFTEKIYWHKELLWLFLIKSKFLVVW